jgi:drug/metabolite transporter (DMT)-like permease
VKHWLMFGALGLIWGSSFLLIKVTVAPAGADPSTVGLLDPLTLAAIRLVCAALGFAVYTALTRRKFATDRRTVTWMIIIGIFNYAIPFGLIPWSERYIDSALASVLQATTPLFSLILAHLALHDDRITAGKVFGLVAGFAGIGLLATRSIDPAHPNPIEGQIAMVLAAGSYGLAAVLTRRFVRHVDGVVTASMTTLVGAVVLSAAVLLTVHPLPNFTAMQPIALRSVLTLGFLNTFLAYVLYFNILPVFGASRTTMVTYLIPPIGISLGVLFEQEHVDWKLLLGAAMIVGGVMLANLWKPKAAPGPVPALEKMT